MKNKKFPNWKGGRKKDCLSPEQHTLAWQPVHQMVKDFLATRQFDTKSFYRKAIDSQPCLKPPCYSCKSMNRCADTARECKRFETYCKHQAKEPIPLYLKLNGN